MAEFVRLRDAADKVDIWVRPEDIACFQSLPELPDDVYVVFKSDESATYHISPAELLARIRVAQ